MEPPVEVVKYADPTGANHHCSDMAEHNLPDGADSSGAPNMIGEKGLTIALGAFGPHKNLSNLNSLMIDRDRITDLTGTCAGRCDTMSCHDPLTTTLENGSGVPDISEEDGSTYDFHWTVHSLEYSKETKSVTEEGLEASVHRIRLPIDSSSRSNGH